VSLDSLEKLLWDLNVDRAAKEKFRADADSLMARFQLTDMERDMIKGFDLRGLADQGVNVMLLMGYWMELEGSRSLKTYLTRMQGPVLTKEVANG
jgi:Aromatic-ring-opening dioxygenase LigAB, LigA subunit